MIKFIVLIVSFVLLFLYFSKDDGVDLSSTVPSEVSETGGAIIDIKNEVNSFKMASNKSYLNSHLQDVADLLKPISNIELENSWELEYGCDTECEDNFLDAKTYKEALWMKRKGYLAKSTIDLLNVLSHEELKDLAKHQNLNAQKLLTINAIQANDISEAKKYGVLARGNEVYKGTYALRLMSQVYRMENQSGSAVLDLRVAALLGDVGASNDFAVLTHASSSTFINDINEVAFRYLSITLQTPVVDWNSDPRPIDDGGG